MKYGRLLPKERIQNYNEKRKYAAARIVNQEYGLRPYYPACGLRASVALGHTCGVSLYSKPQTTNLKLKYAAARI